jgi:tripartite-type tricarboxylate transporter receptor subunit TctC
MVATLALGLGGHAVLAQDYPSRPVEVIVPFGAGSGSDLLARVMFDRIGTRLNQRFVIDNRPAAGGNVGTAAAAKAAADGYTLLFNASGPLTINKSLYKSLPYDPEQDFDPVSLVAVLPNIMVASATLPVSSVSEFIAYAKKSPSPLNYSSPGNGTSTHISGAYFAHVTGLKMTHVPYRSTTQLVSDLISGQVPLSFLFLSAVAGPVQTGQLKALAVTSTQRIAALPSTPTMRESGVADYESAGWFAVVAPKGTPKAIVERLNREIVDAIADPAVVAKFSELGAIAKTSTPAELRDFMAKETIKWRDVIASTGITIEQ